MLYIGTTEDDKASLRKAAQRGKLTALGRGIYTDEPENDAQQLRENVLAIVGRLLPDWHLSYSTAAMLTHNGGKVFVSSNSTTHSPIVLPGLKIVRGQDLLRPEVEWIESPTMVASSLRSAPARVRVQVSSPLQTVFECLSASARSYEERTLPETKLVELIESLSQPDRERAKAFAMRNDLQVEYYRYLELLEQVRTFQPVRVGRRREFTLFFYGWEIGKLTGLSGSYRFDYVPKWQVPLSRQLPIDLNPAYDGQALPAFFDNLLPEGWMEAQLQATFKIAKEDKLGLLATSQKYLSNLTLRSGELESADVVFDSMQVKLSDVAPNAGSILTVDDHIIQNTTLQDALQGIGARGPMRISGVQAKLPVSLERHKDRLTLKLGVLGNSCSHIIKYQSPMFPHLVENEWATMELARRAGLMTANVRMIQRERGTKSKLFAGRALLIERYDISDETDLDGMSSALKLALQEDAASLLMLNRDDKYKASAEQVAKRLMEMNLPEKDLWKFLEHIIFSWFVANGDLHAKNISVIKWLRPGKLGLYPDVDHVSYSPIYDLVNTSLYIENEKFAITVNSRNLNLKKKDFAAIAERWGGSRAIVVQMMEELAESIHANLDEVLELSHLPPDQAEEYRDQVQRHIESSMR